MTDSSKFVEGWQHQCQIALSYPDKSPQCVEAPQTKECLEAVAAEATSVETA